MKGERVAIHVPLFFHDFNTDYRPLEIRVVDVMSFVSTGKVTNDEQSF